MFSQLVDSISLSPFDQASAACGNDVTVFVRSDEDAGGYHITYVRGMMPPFSSEHADTLEEAFELATAAGATGWEPVTE